MRHRPYDYNLNHSPTIHFKHRSRHNLSILNSTQIERAQHGIFPIHWLNDRGDTVSLEKRHEETQMYRYGSVPQTATMVPL